MTDLLPCPFCGGTYLHVDQDVKCDNCMARAPYSLWNIRAGGDAQAAWHPMATAPKDRVLFVRRHNDCMYEYDIVWWDANDSAYPWSANGTAYPEGRLDEWLDPASLVSSTHEAPRSEDQS